MNGIKALSLEETLDVIAASETGRAKEVHGATYASHNEGFGVLCEEIQEMMDEARCLKHYADHLCRYVRADDAAGMADALVAMRKTAIRAAAEAVQVAAVCGKWMEGLDHAEDES